MSEMEVRSKVELENEDEVRKIQKVMQNQWMLQEKQQKEKQVTEWKMEVFEYLIENGIEVQLVQVEKERWFHRK